MRSANPALNNKTFEFEVTPEVQAARAAGQVMTLNGTVNKTALLLLVLVMSATTVWNRFFESGGNPAAVKGWMMGGILVGLGLVIATMFKKHWAPLTAPAYAVAEGFALGGISAMFEAMFPGIVMQAVALTMMVAFALLIAYRSGMIRATENFKLGVAAATGGIFLFYMLSMVLGFFGIQMPMLHSSGALGIGFSLFVVTIAALNLVLDFDFIEHGAATGAPKYMEWFAALGLMVTLVWLYLEILNLLAKLNSRE
ncbi:MAG: Bax inhibitor-1/YccA family protein [Nitrospirae bacterium]|nr:Bax inhibitor-1/YccA family protein [Nitrospirota bacterium]